MLTQATWRTPSGEKLSKQRRSPSFFRGASLEPEPVALTLLQALSGVEVFKFCWEESRNKLTTRDPNIDLKQVGSLSYKSS